MPIKPLRKAVFPVGGLGTRFLPATKAMPKEMLPIVDRPLIQYAVDEALEAGIEQMIFVTGRGKSAIEDHFDIAYELEATMAARGKSLDALDQTRLAPGAVAYVRQQEPMGLGHAVWCARDIVGDEPFAVLLADDFMLGKPGCLKQMVDAYMQVGGNLIHGCTACRRAPSTASCNKPFVATSPGFLASVRPAPKSSSRPSKSVIRPPASSTAKAPAATSHIFSR